MESVYGRSDTRIGVGAGETFIVELEGNPTTGYQWTLNPDAAGGEGKLRILNKEFKPAGSGVGAGGRQRFRIEAVSPGKAELRAEYKRPWDSTARDSVVFQVDIRK